MNVIKIGKNIIVLILKDNISYGTLIIIILVEINSGLVFILLRGISERVKIFNTYNKIGISVGIRSGNTRGRINYFTSTKNRIELTEN